MTRALAVALATIAFAAAPARAEVTATDAWVRGTVASQMATGAYMKLRSTEDAKVVAAASPAAAVVEIHEMAMKDNVMTMRAVPALALPAGKTVEMKPNGYHVMLMDLAKPLKAGERVPIELTVESKGGRRAKVLVQAEVRALGAAPGK